MATEEGVMPGLTVPTLNKCTWASYLPEFVEYQAILGGGLTVLTVLPSFLSLS